MCLRCYTTFIDSPDKLHFLAPLWTVGFTYMFNLQMCLMAQIQIKIRNWEEKF